MIDSHPIQGSHIIHTMTCVLLRYSLGISWSKECRYSIPLAMSNANFIACSWSTIIPVGITNLMS